MIKSNEIKQLAVALVKFQSSLKAVKKDAENPFFKSKYADLASIIEAIREPLAKNGLAFSQFPSGEGGLTTILLHESGEYIEETFTMKPVDGKPQSAGSAITYARRYALGAVLGVATEEDDDGNAASAPVESPSYPKKPIVERTCVSCGSQFKTSYPKSVTCFPCFQKTKTAKSEYDPNEPPF